MDTRTTGVQMPGTLESAAQPDPSSCTEPQSRAPGPAWCLPRAAPSSPSTGLRTLTPARSRPPSPRHRRPSGHTQRSARQGAPWATSSMRSALSRVCPGSGRDRRLRWCNRRLGRPMAPRHSSTPFFRLASSGKPRPWPREASHSGAHWVAVQFVPCSPPLSAPAGSAAAAAAMAQ